MSMNPFEWRVDNCATCEKPIANYRAGYFVLLHSPQESTWLECCLVHHPAHSPNQLTDIRGQYMQNCFPFEFLQTHVGEAKEGHKGLFLTFPLDALVEFSESHLTIEVGTHGDYLTYNIDHELSKYESDEKLSWDRTVEGLKVLLPEHFNN